jgi:hypothetical protein
MTWLKIEDLKPGMILAEPVHSHQEVLLLAAGSKISKKNIRILKSWGIHRVFVKSESPPLPISGGVVDSEVTPSIIKEIEAKFSEVLDDPVMGEILKAASKQLNRRLQNDKKENGHHSRSGKNYRQD